MTAETIQPTQPERSELTPLLIDIGALSKLLQRSVASLYRDDTAGRLPAALKIGGSKRWRYGEIVAWVEAGMPDRNTWETLQKARSGPQCASPTPERV